MAKKREKKLPTDVAEPVAKTKPNREGRNFNFWIDGDLAKAFLAYCDSFEAKPSFTAHLEIALREYLQKRNAWPLKKADH